MDELFAHWLLPAEPSRGEFARIIGELSRRFGVPEFDPHLTLDAIRRPSGGAPPELGTAIAGIPPVALQIRGIAHSAEFTRTLFIEFESSPLLETLAARVARLTTSKYTLKPHLSLVYARLSNGQREALKNEIHLGFSEVVFDRVRVITGTPTVQSGRDVQSWQPIAEAALSDRLIRE
jgi:2'-5' RNA ligase